MKIAIVGTGYVGLVSAACFASVGHDVVCVDIDPKKIEMLRLGKSPIYEPGLEEILKDGIAKKKLTFTTELNEALPETKVLFCAVGTPQGENHKADLRAVFAVTESVATLATDNLIIVNKSTVPVGTGKECEKRIAAVLAKRKVKISLPVISNPEFLREGSAVQDTLKPDRIIVGIDEVSDAAYEIKQTMETLYASIGKPIFMDRESAEIVKYASNAFLATKISFINMLSELAEKTGANIDNIAYGMGSDKRIGDQFLQAGIGYGGSCFPKDVKALLATAEELKIPMPIVEATDQVNVRQRQRFIERLLKALPKISTIAVWGLSFKPKTDDMRDAPSIDVIEALVKAGHTVQAYDPVAMEQAKPLLPSSVRYTASARAALQGSDALVLVTEWGDFRNIPYPEMKKVLKGKLIADGRNFFTNIDQIKADGLQYIGIGI
jgi:UDPglucose 6-dehydrogenase